MNKRIQSKNGFTLIELIVVIAVIAILVLLAMPRLTGHIEHTKLTHIRNDIKAAENMMDAYLIDNDEMPAEWGDVTVAYLTDHARSGLLYDTRGVSTVVADGNYKEINKELLKKNIKTKLKGSFYSNQGGKVYYEHKGTLGEVNDTDLFDRDIDVSDTSDGKFKVLDYNFPNGIFVTGDTIMGYVKVEGIQTGTYELNVDLIHAKSKSTINVSKPFELNAKEIKVIDFNYKVTSADRIGFYDFNLEINEDLTSLVKYKVLNSIYITRSEWEYFYEDDFNEVYFEHIGGVGSLDPSKVSYNYVVEDSGVDYSSVIFDIYADDNKTGQISTKLPITYGTYEASMKVPDNKALLNGLFLYGPDKHNPNITYEIDMEVLFYEGKWQLWTTIFNESHRDYVAGEEPGVIFNKRIDLSFDPSKGLHNYRIDFYQDYISFALDGNEVSRWNKSLDYGEMHMYAGTFYTHWLTGELSTSPLQMNVQWMRRGYFPQ